MQLRLPVEVRIEHSSIERLYRHLRIEEVLSYCKGCHNYESNHSCPSFPFEIKKYLDDYAYVAVIMTKMDTIEFGEYLDKIKFEDIRSAVYDKYTDSSEEDKYDKISAIAMYAFNHIKDDVTEKLLALENKQVSISLPPGSCTRCKSCMKERNTSCAHPEKLRYSLEALGFLVSAIYEDYFETELEFSRGTLPSAFYTCSAILSKEPIEIAYVYKALEDLYMDLIIED